MRINLITIGKKMPNWINLGIEHYQKQLPNYYNFTITSLESQNRKSSSSENLKNLEAKLLLEAASDSTLLIAFDEIGSQKTSKQISKSIESWQLDGENVALIHWRRRWAFFRNEREMSSGLGAFQSNNDTLNGKTIW